MNKMEVIAMTKMFELTHGVFVNSHNGAAYPVSSLVVRGDRVAELLAWYAGAGCADAVARELSVEEYGARVRKTLQAIRG
jgi:hypothetical protein